MKEDEYDVFKQMLEVKHKIDILKFYRAYVTSIGYGHFECGMFIHHPKTQSFTYASSSIPYIECHY